MPSSGLQRCQTTLYASKEQYISTKFFFKGFKLSRNIACVYMCECCFSKYVWVGICTCIGQMLISGFSSTLRLIFRGRPSWWSWSSLIWLDSLTCRSHKPLCLCLTSAGVASTCYNNAWLFKMGAGDGTEVLLHVCRALDVLIHHHRPCAVLFLPV